MDAVLEGYLKTYTNKRSSEVSETPQVNFVSVDVAIDCFEKGKSIGEEEFKKKVKENAQMLVKKQVTATVEVVQQILKIFKEKSFEPFKLFLSVDIDSSKILITISEKQHYTDEFINIFYSFASDIENTYLIQNINFEINAIDESKNLNLDLLKGDGYEFGYNLINGTKIF